MKTLVISGAGGFLGRNLLSLADSNRFDVYALSSKIGDTPGVHYVFREKIEEIPWNRVDVLINCAFPRNSDGAQMALGLDYIRRLLQSATDGGVGAVINISSQSVYSQTRDHAADESEPLNLESTYAVGKYATELFLDSICRTIPHTNLRMASLIGPGFDQRVVNKLVRRALSGQSISLKIGDQKYGFLDVRDAVRAILLVAENPDAWQSSVYNLGTEEVLTLREIGSAVKDVVEQMTGRTVELFEEPSDAKHNSSLNASLLQATFDWQPFYTVRDTTHAICEWEFQRP